MTALQEAGVAPRAGGARAARGDARRGVPATSPVPWAPSDLTRLFVCNLVGAFGVLAAWLGVSGTERLSSQFDYSSLGVLAFLVASFGNGSWLLAGRRAVGARLADLLDGDQRTRPDLGTAGPADVGEAPTRPVASRFATGALVTVPGTVRYHFDGCALVRGKPVQQDDLDGHAAAGLRPCELCLRDQDAAPA